MGQQYLDSRVVVKTDVGCLRTRNEDSIAWFELKGRHFLFLADGMGGEAGGSMASTTAVEACRRVIHAAPAGEPRELISMCFHAANVAVLEKKRRRPELKRMGTTLIVLIVEKGRYWWGSVGDSRVHRVLAEGCSVASRDHTVTQEMFDNGSITRAQLSDHPHRHVLTKAIGISESAEPDITVHPNSLGSGEGVLLCSDGLSDLVEAGEIGRILRRYGPEKGVDVLVETAKSRGGPDNISIMLIHAGMKKTTRVLPYAIAAVAAVALILGVYGWNSSRSPGGDSGLSLPLYTWCEQEASPFQSEGTGLLINVENENGEESLKIEVEDDRAGSIVVEAFSLGSDLKGVRTWSAVLRSFPEGDAIILTREQHLRGRVPIATCDSMAASSRLLFIVHNNSIDVRNAEKIGALDFQTSALIPTSSTAALNLPLSRRFDSLAVAGFDSIVVWEIVDPIVLDFFTREEQSNKSEEGTFAEAAMRDVVRAEDNMSDDTLDEGEQAGANVDRTESIQ